MNSDGSCDMRRTVQNGKNPEKPELGTFFSKLADL
jgi:hypothetical protein